MPGGAFEGLDSMSEGLAWLSWERLYLAMWPYFALTLGSSTPAQCAFRPCILVGPVCCVFELQWCGLCGEDADRTCDVCFRCQTNRCLLFGCCGPQCDTPLCANCCDCGSDSEAEAKVTIQECCECDCRAPPRPNAYPVPS